jgi:trk system potassium uptake protein
MHFRSVLGNLGTIIRLFSFSLLLPIIPAVVYESGGPGFDVAEYFVPQNAALFGALFLLTLALGVLLEVAMGKEDFRDAEAFLLVGLGYLVVAALGALPYLFSGVIPNPLDAYFESMSGITTVGATVMSYPLEVHPPSILFWRSLTQWLGGMGFIVLGVALLPRLLEGGGALLRAEFSGGSVRLRPKLAETARSLWGIYIIFTAAGVAVVALLLHLGGMAPSLAIFEAVNHVFTSIATAGFSTRTSSLAGLQNPAVELVLSVLMLAGATSFVLHYRAIHGGGLKSYLQEEEFKFLGVLILGTTVVIAAIVFLVGTPEAWATMGGAPDPLQALRHSLVTVVSAVTTSGFATTDFDAWPDAARILILLLMLTGGMAGSTAGGVKVFRVLVLMKLLRREALRIVRPRAVLSVRMRGEVVDEGTLHTISAFFFAYITVLLVSSIVLTFTGLDMVAAFAASAATVSTFGPGLGAVVGGPDFSYALVHPVAKVVLVFNMWFGRLEIFAALLLLLPSTYRR